MAEYIEREALLEDLKLLAKHQQGERQQGILGVCVTIKNRPTADVVEVKHGEWINVQDFGGGKCFADCSICGTQEKAPNPTALKMFRRYCSYCGAYMKGGAEG